MHVRLVPVIDNTNLTHVCKVSAAEGRTTVFMGAAGHLAELICFEQLSPFHPAHLLCTLYSIVRSCKAFQTTLMVSDIPQWSLLFFLL